jgi:hypothetical protein
MNEAEYKKLLLRQEEILIDAKGVANSVSKVNNSAGKAILAQITSTALSAVGLRIQIPSNLGYATLGAFGILFLQRDANKLKKYYARLNELQDEYNANRLKIAEYNIEINTGATVTNNYKNEPILNSKTESLVSATVRSAKENPTSAVLIFVATGLVLRKIINRKNV